MYVHTAAIPHTTPAYDVISYQTDLAKILNLSHTSVKCRAADTEPIQPLLETHTKLDQPLTSYSSLGDGEKMVVLF